MVEISETRLKGDKLTTFPIYIFENKSHSLKRTGNKSEIEEKIMLSLDLNKEGYGKEIREREEFLKKISKKKICFFETVLSFQGYERRMEGAG